MEIRLIPAVRFKLLEYSNFYQIMTGECHLDIYRRMHQLELKIYDIEEGFLYNDTVFISRKAATKLCIAKHILPSSWKEPLTSEILWKFTKSL